MQTMDALSGLYDQLAAAVSRRRGGFSSPVTVAEIYQELVPYRSVRDSVGFAMNADYEHALLRLLAGESELARLEPAAAADAMRRELRSSNPNVSMYREYAACDVWIAEPAATSGTAATEPPRRLEVHASGDDEEPEDGRVVATIRPEQEERAAADVAPAGGSEMRNGLETAGRRAGSDEAPAAPAAGPAAAGSAAEVTRSRAGCVFCDSPLPQGRQVRFCPYCGADQSKRPCSECGEVLEPEWVYCIACGSNAG